MKRPYDAETVQEGLKQRISRSNSVLPPKGICGAIVGSLDKACCGKPDRDKLLFHLFDVTTSKELTAPQWNALLEWVKVFKNDEPPPAWGYSEYLAAECQAILDNIKYNGMSDEEKRVELQTRMLAREKWTHPLRVNQRLPEEFDQWESDNFSAEDCIEEIGY